MTTLLYMEQQEQNANGTEVALRWPRHRRSVGLARTELRKTLSDWGLVAAEDGALIVLSELLTNAVRHARVPPGREIETRFFREKDGLRIEVHDAADEWPELRALREDAADGRGLLIVAALADAWGVKSRDGVGKAVWATVSDPGQRCPP